MTSICDDLGYIIPSRSPYTDLCSKQSLLNNVRSFIPDIVPANSFANFYALMPGDNAATVAPGSSIEFPEDGEISGNIVRIDDSSFDLVDIGTYQVWFQASVDEAGQLVVALDGVELVHTVVGRATGTSQIVGMSIIRTTSENSIITVDNPSGNAGALTITPIAGGAAAVSANLMILKLA
jgi:hypothetical protein